MGLDMYLEAEQYFSDMFEPGTYKIILAASGLTDLASKQAPGLTVSVPVAYWRKANAVHNWFVQNVQNGVDDCGRYYVSPEKLGTLYDTVSDALDFYNDGNAAKAAELLPPTAGFFFGSTELDEDYKYDLQLTLDQLAPLLDLSKYDFYYHSSW